MSIKHFLHLEKINNRSTIDLEKTIYKLTHVNIQWKRRIKVIRVV